VTDIPLIARVVIPCKTCKTGVIHKVERYSCAALDLSCSFLNDIVEKKEHDEGSLSSSEMLAGVKDKWRDLRRLSDPTTDSQLRTYRMCFFGKVSH
jgi:hypothetical protein